MSQPLAIEKAREIVAWDRDYPRDFIELREGHMRDIRTLADINTLANALGEPWGLGPDAIDVRITQESVGRSYSEAVLELDVNYERQRQVEEEREEE